MMELRLNQEKYFFEGITAKVANLSREVSTAPFNLMYRPSTTYEKNLERLGERDSLMNSLVCWGVGVSVLPAIFTEFIPHYLIMHLGINLLDVVANGFEKYLTNETIRGDVDLEQITSESGE